MKKTKIEQQFEKSYEQFKQKDTASQILFAILFFFALPIILLIMFGVMGFIINLFGTILFSIGIDAVICYLLFTGFWYEKWNGIPRKTIFLLFSAAWILSVFGSGWNFWAIVPFLLIWYFRGRELSLPANEKNKQ